MCHGACQRQAKTGDEKQSTRDTEDNPKRREEKRREEKRREEKRREEKEKRKEKKKGKEKTGFPARP